jgi:hypothetical protein
MSSPTNQWHRQLFYPPPLAPKVDIWEPTCNSLSQDPYIIINKLTPRSLTTLPSNKTTELGLKKPPQKFGHAEALSMPVSPTSLHCFADEDSCSGTWDELLLA